MGGDQEKTVGELLAEALPQVMAVGLIAIGGLLFSMQISFTRIDANVQQLVKAMEELRTDTKSHLDDLEQRVRSLEINRK
jgi:hypothetical protein